ncbi:MAG: hypothetical protein ACM3KR_00380 [Deltaproteobacteria bacterium]
MTEKIKALEEQLTQSENSNKQLRHELTQSEITNKQLSNELSQSENTNKQLVDENAELHTLSEKDGLTNLCNKKNFEISLNKKIAR